MFDYMTPLDKLSEGASRARDEGVAPGSGRVAVAVARGGEGDGAGGGEGDGATGAERGAAAGATGATEGRVVHGHAFVVEAHDAHSLLFAFLDELLFHFHTSMLVCTKIQVATIDRTRWRVECVALGEKFVDGVHEQGTEIKAITYSAMQILEAGEGKDGCAEVFVIVDI
jgi:SHS2 domain-containing protein